MIYNEIDIFENAYEGYGVGRLPDGKVVFIPFAVAGDNVDILIKKDKKRFAYGEIVKINKRSKYRVDGFCRYEGVCGGCTFAFLDSNYERVVKTQIVEKFFRFIDDFKIDQYIRSESLQYRLRGRFKVKKGNLGFYQFESHDFFPIESCPVMKRSLFEKSVLAAKSHGYEDVVDLSIVENDNGEELIYIDTDKVLEGATSLNLRTKNKQSGKDKIYIRVGGYNIPTVANGFFQTNRYLLYDFQKIVLDALEGSYNILELYCGSGFFTIPLWRNGKKVLGVDSNRLALDLLGKEIGTKRCKLLDINRDIEKLKFNFDAVLMDPDRDGASQKVINYLVTNKPQLVVYVSCNPLTMARDIKGLMDHYYLEKFHIIDQFPKTYHIESMAVLKRQ